MKRLIFLSSTSTRKIWCFHNHVELLACFRRVFPPLRAATSTYLRYVRLRCRCFWTDRCHLVPFWGSGTRYWRGRPARRGGRGTCRSCVSSRSVLSQSRFFERKKDHLISRLKVFLQYLLHSKPDQQPCSCQSDKSLLNSSVQTIQFLFFRGPVTFTRAPKSSALQNILPRSFTLLTSRGGLAPDP